MHRKRDPTRIAGTRYDIENECNLKIDTETKRINEETKYDVNLLPLKYPHYIKPTKLMENVEKSEAGSFLNGMITGCKKMEYLRSHGEEGSLQKTIVDDFFKGFDMVGNSIKGIMEKRILDMHWYSKQRFFEMFNNICKAVGETKGHNPNDDDYDTIEFCKEVTKLNWKFS